MIQLRMCKSLFPVNIACGDTNGDGEEISLSLTNSDYAYNQKTTMDADAGVVCQPVGNAGVVKLTLPMLMFNFDLIQVTLALAVSNFPNVGNGC